MKTQPKGAASTIDPALAKTHQALFDTWFPLDDLPIPASIKPDIALIAAGVSKAMLEGFSNSVGISKLLGGLTYPANLPFYSCLKQSDNTAVQSFLASPGGYGGMPAAQRSPLFFIPV
jgi:hypothetical protein